MSCNSSNISQICAEIATLNHANAHQRLAAKITDARHVLQSLLSLQNALSIIFRFPDEIWIYIGRLIYQSTELRWATHGGVGKEALSTTFLPLTQTCQYFRNVFTTMPEFWTCIDTQSPQMAVICRQRSGNSPLTLMYNDTTDQRDCSASCAGSGGCCGASRGKVLGLPGFKNHIDLGERVHVLKVHAYDGDMSTLAVILHSRQFPSLRKLKLHSEVDATRPLEDPVNTAPTFAGLLPIFFPVNNLDHPFTTLKELDLCSLPGAMIPTIHALAHILRACPSLVSLRLVQATPPAMDFPEKLEPVSLPCLQRINIRHHWPAVVSILRLIDCPSLDELNIATEVGSEFEVPDLPVFARIRESKNREITVVGYQVSSQSLAPLKHRITIEGSAPYSSRSYFATGMFQLGAIVGGEECTQLEINSRSTIPSNFDYTPLDCGRNHNFPSTANGWKAAYDVFPGVEKLRLVQLGACLANAVEEIQDRLPCLISLDIEGLVGSFDCLRVKHRDCLNIRTAATGDL